MEEKVHKFATTQYLQKQLQVVAQNARAVVVPSFVVGEEPLLGKEEAEDGEEEIDAGGVVLRVSSLLASLSASEMRTLLRDGWSKLSDKERAKLRVFLPPNSATAEELLSPDSFAKSLHPVDAFSRRFRLGLLQPRVVALRAKLPELARRVSALQMTANRREAELVKRAQSEAARFRLVNHSNQLVWPETGDDVNSAESEYIKTVQRPRPAPIRPVQPKKRKEVPEEAVAASPAGGIGGGIALDERSSGAGLTRAQRKTQSRIVGGLFLSAFNTLIKIRELLLLRRRQQQPLPAAAELVTMLAADPVVANDLVDGMNASQLAHVAVLFAQQATRCHKTTFGPYIALNGGKMEWIDDSNFDELEVFLELESAERLLRYGLSRAFVDVTTGIMSHLAIKDLTNNPVTVKRMTPEQRRDFHRQEWARFENAGQPFCYRLPGQRAVCVAGQRNKNLLKSARKHAMLLDARPHTVTLQDVVRDALARLPQGVGTKADLQVLVLDSQFVVQDVNAAVLASSVSDCLDRLSAVSDPGASFEATSRLWAYLHRNRGLNELAGDDE